MLWQKEKNLGYYALFLPYPALCDLWISLGFGFSDSLFLTGFFSLSLLFFFSATEIVHHSQKSLLLPLGLNFGLSLLYALSAEVYQNLGNSAFNIGFLPTPLLGVTFLVYFSLNLTRQMQKRSVPSQGERALLWLNALPYPLILYLIFYLLERTERAVLGWLLLGTLLLSLLLLALGAYGLYKAGNRLDFLMSTLVSSFLVLFFVFIFDTAGANTYPKLSFLKEALFVLTSFILWMQCFFTSLGLSAKKNTPYSI